MDHDTKENLAAAARLLIKRDDGPTLYQMMLECAGLMHKYRELRFVGAADALTTLALLKFRNANAYAGVIDLVSLKRKENGFPPLIDDPDTGFDKDAYMAEFMQQKRVRLRRAAEIENLRRPERDKLIGKARLEFMDRQSVIWASQREAALEKAKTTKGRKLTKDERRSVVDAFWQQVDDTMDELEAAIRSPKSGVSVSELEAALRFDPYKV